MNGAPPFLQLKQVSKKYDERTVLSNISFEQHAHEIICLLGESGSGKTTTLMLIAGLEQPQSGEIWIGGEKKTSADKFVPPEKRHVGFVFQDYALFPHLSVGRNVSFGIRGLSRADRKARVLHELTRLGVEEYIDLYPHQLSGGERQRVALARALAADPRLLLMDEPFASLDKQWRERLREETLSLLRERATPCIFVTHDPEEACYIADKIVLLHHGSIIQQGTPPVLYHEPASLQAAQFFGKVNHFKARVSQGALRVGESFVLPLPASAPFSEGEEVQVAFRPEAFTDQPTAITLTADVLESRFLGKITEFSLRLRGTDTTLSAQRMVLGAAAAPQFHLDPKSVYLFRV